MTIRELGRRKDMETEEPKVAVVGRHSLKWHVVVVLGTMLCFLQPRGL